MTWLQKMTPKCYLYFDYLFFIGWISIKAWAIRCVHAFQSAWPCFNQFVFGPFAMIWKLVQVAYLCILFQNENGVEDLLLQGSRYKQIMRYKVLLTIFLVGWISSEFGATGLHTSITSGNLVTSLSSMWIWVNVYESDLWIFKQNFKVISFYQSSYGMK